MAGAAFGDVGVSLFVAGAAFGDVRVSLFVAVAAFGEFLQDSRSANILMYFPIFPNTNCVSKARKVTSAHGRVRAQHLVMLENHVPWQAQHLVMLENHVPRQAQHLVMLEYDFLVVLERHFS